MLGFFRSRGNKSPSSNRRANDQAGRRVERATREELDARYTFRRSHTITGSASSEVTTLSERAAQLKSPRVQAHDLSHYRRRLGIILSVVLMGCVLLAVVVSQFTATPNVIINNDRSVAPQSNYARTIQQYLNGSPIERIRFMLDERRLATYMQLQHPEVESISLNGGTALGESDFTIAMRSPVVGWVNGMQQYVDRSGAAFTVSYNPTPPGVQIVDQSGIRLQNNQTLASDRFLSFVGKVIGLSHSHQQLTVTEVVIPSGMTRAIEVKLDGVSYPIKLSTDRPVGEQVEDMARAVAWMRQRGITPSYIDVRVSRDAFYR